jgi:DNA-directed RNA polymerase specialized sigma24 family protein
MERSQRKDVTGAEVYATSADFEQIFTNDMSSLYLLSFVLAGDPVKAETVFAAGIEESTKKKRVFKDWARSWARRSVVQSAIRIIQPQQHPHDVSRTPAVAHAIEKLPLALQAEAAAIVGLEPIERFVFVMSILERYSDHECSILLGCTRRDVTTAREGALQKLGTLLNFRNSDADTSAHSTAPGNSRLAIDLTIARYFATQVWTHMPSQDAALRP